MGLEGCNETLHCNETLQTTLGAERADKAPDRRNVRFGGCYHTVTCSRLVAAYLDESQRRPTWQDLGVFAYHNTGVFG